MKHDIVHGNHIYKCDINYGDAKFVLYGGVHRTGRFWIRFCTSNNREYIKIANSRIRIAPSNRLVRNSLLPTDFIYCDFNFKALEYILAVGK